MGCAEMADAATRYERPSHLSGALELLASGGESWSLLAGGTDFYPVLTHEATWSAPRPRQILDLTAVEELDGITETDSTVRIGALVCWSDVVSAELPEYFDCLRQAAIEVGGVQIQNRGTVVGNLCNASPAADGVPALLALDATVELVSLERSRTLPLAEFVLGNRRTARCPDEIVSSVIVRKRSTRSRSRFLKLGSRRYLVISIASAAVVIETDDEGEITDAAIAVGACSEVPVRIGALEAALIGRELGPEARDCVERHAFDELSPIDDVRASRDYRQRAAKILAARALDALTEVDR